ncbi:MAG TPA: family 1 encapsulin nanocompartment shell protein, partial [Candidatus Acidoferrales bacterium]|nr:family 1 encapsulin nanocompartment shell protein [Candidatus Acidoferrales bacterium]
MSILRRHLAPISPAAWEAIDDEARRVLKLSLAARKLVDFNGPKGLRKSAINIGRIEALRNGPAQGVQAARRVVQPLIEVRATFDLLRSE